VQQIHKRFLLLGIGGLIILAACQLFSPVDPGTVVVTPANRPEQIELPEVDVVNYPHLDGSTSTLPLDTLLACSWLKVECEWVVWFDGSRYLMPTLGETGTAFPDIQHHGTHDAYVNLISGDADLIFVARLPSSDELKLAGDKHVELEVAPVALDAFVFIVNIENPVESLTIQQIQEIYTGGITHWGEVGGDDAEIHPYQRNDNSGSQELMKSLVMDGLKMIAAPEMMLPTMMAPINAISDDPLGIGYSVYFYEQFMAPNQHLKLLGVEGMVPDSGSIQTREYLLATEVYVVLRTDLPHDSLAYLLRDWVLTTEGQSVVAASGYVAIR
jgi:phosphate transport system substrate-binding protein